MKKIECHTQIDSNHVKRCSTHSWGTCKLRSELAFTFISPVWKDMEHLNFYTVDGYKVLSVSTEAEHTCFLWFNNFTSKCMSNRSTNICTNISKDIYIDTHWSLIIKITNCKCLLICKLWNNYSNSTIQLWEWAIISAATCMNLTNSMLSRAARHKKVHIVWLCLEKVQN